MSEKANGAPNGAPNGVANGAANGDAKQCNHHHNGMSQEAEEVLGTHLRTQSLKDLNSVCINAV